MKLFVFLILLFFGLIIFESCNDFIELEPITSSTTGNSFKRIEDIEAALVSAYNTLYCEYYSWDNILLNDVRSDNCYAGSTDDAEIYSYDMLTIDAANSRLFNNWRFLYNGISRANTVLEKINEVDIVDEERSKVIIGEAKFLRGLFYFDLVKLFGGVPIVSEVISESVENPFVSRNSVDELYEYIIEDLLEAAKLLPDEFKNDVGRATKGAANALLAKVWAQRPSRDYSKVIHYCNEVINSEAGYSLVSDFNLLFDGYNYNNVESIFEIQYKGGTIYGNWGAQLFLPPSISNDEWRKYGTPSIDLVNLFLAENDTVRMNASIIWERVNWVDEYWSPIAGNAEIPFIYKQKHADAWSSSNHFYLLRLADILLLKAEAMAHLKEYDASRIILNQIRNRVHLDDSKVDDSELLDAILNERRLELAFESHRWDDLVRYGKAEGTMKELRELNQITGNYINYNMSYYKLVLPIPQEEIVRNSKLEQNTGY